MGRFLSQKDIYYFSLMFKTLHANQYKKMIIIKFVLKFDMSLNFPKNLILVVKQPIYFSLSKFRFISCTANLPYIDGLGLIVNNK
jgi:hypothetical protein